MRLWTTILLLSLACARRDGNVTRAPETQFLRTMPSPNGCYLQVWEQPQYEGQFDYINGPRSYADLRNMPSQLNLEHRIGSVRSGPTATATVFTERNFQGSSFDVGERAGFAALPSSMNQRVASVRVRCSATTDGAR